MATKANAAITSTALRDLEDAFAADDTNRVMQNAVTQVSAQKLAVRRDVVAEADHSFSVKLDHWEVTAQKGSGRCWLFAGLNVLRAAAMKKMKLKNFEFSQNWPLFWDKLEKANYFLESIIDTADRPAGDRTVAFLLSDPISDGGQWNMFVDLIEKYGLVPKTAMPETESSSNTGVMNQLLVAKLRQGAYILRDLHASGAPLADLRAAKLEFLTTVHRILSIHLGTPPTTFDWQWHDKNDKFHRDANMTPKRFAKKYVSAPLDDYVCLVHDPRTSSPVGRTFTVEYLGNVVGGKPVVYLNVEMPLLKRVARRTLGDGEPVWFGCDTSKQMDRDVGMWDVRLQDYESIYQTDFALDKATRLEYGATAMNHAMVFTGVDIKSGKPRRWRVENSWGDATGQKGFFLMNDSWFDEHLFEIAARKKYLPQKLRAALDRKPIVLPAWDPMGSLARVSAIGQPPSCTCAVSP
ncbi:MAG: C1 family peptidase [Planctomycetota bacterium]|jgi:bleomycin hydrolase|nr:C1 family peptidase [Planctomycetota bacterium]